MKKILFTLALGLFFVTFTNAQSTVSETADATAQVVVEKKACEPGCTKECCTGEKADAKKTVKDSKSCDDKSAKKGCATKAKGCATKKRPDACKH